jgi:hypothetical protein
VLSIEMDIRTPMGNQAALRSITTEVLLAPQSVS